jgi:hypothetical protein
MKVLATAPGLVLTEEIAIVRTISGIEVVRLGPRGRRVASLALDLAELDEFANAVHAAQAEIEVEQRAAAAGTRTPGPPIVDLRELGLDEGGE